MSKVVKLFSCLPICRIEEDEHRKKYYLFGLIPFLKVKNDKFDGYNNVWTQKIYRECPQVGERLWCGGKTLLTRNTFLGIHCCFNGCEIHGAGNSLLDLISIYIY